MDLFGGKMKYIETERLILRNYKESDFDDYWEYASQPNVYPRSGWPAYTEKKKAIEQLKREIERPFQFAILLKNNNKVVGSISLKPTRDGMLEKFNLLFNETKEIGYLLNEKFWGQGIMTEAMKAIIKYGFDDLGLKVITAGYFEPNIASGKVQAKCGLKPFQTTKDSVIWYETGKPAAAIDCEITKEEYDKMKEYKTLKIKVVDSDSEKK